MSDGHRPSASLEEEQPEDMLGGEGQDGTTDQRVAEDAHTEGTPPSEQTKGPVKRKRRQASSARQKGDNTLQHYTGALHQMLVVLVLRLRRYIACEDAFPCPLDFGVMTEMIVTDFPLFSHLSPFVYLLFDAYGNWSVCVVTIHVYKPMSKSSKP